MDLTIQNLNCTLHLDGENHNFQINSSKQTLKEIQAFIMLIDVLEHVGNLKPEISMKHPLILSKPGDIKISIMIKDRKYLLNISSVNQNKTVELSKESIKMFLNTFKFEIQH